MTTTINYKKIAKILIKASEEVLIEPNLSWFKSKYPSSEISFRVGSGKRTYFSSEYGSISGSITYGVKMIESCLESYNVASGWTHGKEIINRKYYNGILTPHNCLAAVALHEVAHYYQHLIYERKFGSVHNKEFYKILDKMHNNGKGEEVLNFLMRYDFFSDINFRLKNKTPLNRDFIPINNTKIKKGDYFYFINKDNIEILDCAIRVNSKTVSTKKFKIPYSRITKIVTDKNCSQFLKDLKEYKDNNKEILVDIGDVIEVKINGFSEILTVYSVGLRYVNASTSTRFLRIPKSLIIRKIQ